MWTLDPVRLSILAGRMNWIIRLEVQGGNLGALTTVVRLNHSIEYVNWAYAAVFFEIQVGMSACCGASISTKRSTALETRSINGVGGGSCRHECMLWG
jgi:hypothetical protein